MLLPKLECVEFAGDNFLGFSFKNLVKGVVDEATGIATGNPMAGLKDISGIIGGGKKPAAQNPNPSAAATPATPPTTAEVSGTQAAINSSSAAANNNTVQNAGPATIKKTTITETPAPDPNKKPWYETPGGITIMALGVGTVLTTLYIIFGVKRNK
jgi:hypothetical protein